MTFLLGMALVSSSASEVPFRTLAPRLRLGFFVWEVFGLVFVTGEVGEVEVLPLAPLAALVDARTRLMWDLTAFGVQSIRVLGGLGEMGE